MLTTTPRPVVYRLSARFRGPAPGSTPAKHAGCTCPRRANRHGAGAPAAAWGETGRHETLWLLDLACPTHGQVETAETRSP